MSKVIREVCVAGNVIDITVKVPSGNHTEKRAEKKYITSEHVQKNNDRMAAKKLTRILNANFDKNSAHITLTYRNEPEELEASKNILDRFMARMKYAMKKIGEEFKWVIATEYKGHRIHHHLITNAPRELVEKKWKDGYIFYQPFNNNPNRNQLAEYIVKESQNTFREEGTPFKTRYSHSRNLIIPEVKVEVVSERMLFDEPEAWKGYYIDTDTVRRYEHPITGLEHLEYMMIAETERPRVKKYYKGRKKKREDNFRRYINTEEEQLML